MATLNDIRLQTNDDGMHLLFTDIQVEEGKDTYNTALTVHIKNHMVECVGEQITFHSKHLIKFLYELSDVYFNQQGESKLESVDSSFFVTCKYTYNGYIRVRGHLEELMGENKVYFDYALEQSCFKSIKEILKDVVLKIT